MKFNYHTLLYIGLLPLLAACSSSEGEGEGYYEGFPQKVNLSAATVTVNTRATTDNAEVWAGTERIAVHMKVNNPVENAGFTEATYPYTPSPTGTLTAEDEKNMFYFRSPNDPDRTCDAWYWPMATDGYSQQTPVGNVIAVPTDQSNTAHAANDMLYVAPTTIAYQSRNTIYSLLFCHQLTWVSFQVVADNSSSYDKSDLAATMGTETEPLIYQATFSAPSGQTTSSGSREVFGAYSPTGDEVKSGVIIPHPLATPDVDGVICRYEAVLIPQTLSADGKTTHNLFNITLDGKTYRYNSTMELKAGVHYTFNLKIAKGDKPLLVLAKVDDWQKEVVESEYVIANLWEKGPFTGTTSDGNKWKDKENLGGDNSANDWDDEENSGTTNSGNDWGDKEPTNDSGTTGSSNGWGDKENEENNGSVKVDANSWKKGTEQNASVSAGQDWQKEGETHLY